MFSLRSGMCNCEISLPHCEKVRIASGKNQGDTNVYGNELEQTVLSEHRDDDLVAGLGVVVQQRHASSMRLNE